MTLRVTIASIYAISNRIQMILIEKESAIASARTIVCAHPTVMIR
jgi:hypothetical protein